MTITKTIGVGAGLSSTPDYSTMAGYKAYIEAKSGAFTDNEELVFLWSSSANEITDSLSITCDTGAYRVIFRAETGKSFRDHASKSTNALRYNPANGACIKSSGMCFQTVYGRYSFIGLQIKGTSYVGAPIMLLYAAGGHVVSNNIIQTDDNAFYPTLYQIELNDTGGNGGTTVENNVFLSRGYTVVAQTAGAYSGAITFTGNTFYNYGTTLTPKGITGISGGSAIFYNNAVAGFTTDCDVSSVSGSHNATDKATGGLPSTNRQNSLVPSTEWENVTAGALDFRLKTGSAKCKNLGTASFGLSTDIVGQPRSGAATDIGAWEFQEATAPEIAVSGNGNAITDGDTTPSVTDHTDFGTTPEGTTKSRTFTITNSGDADLVISSVALSGTDAAEFTITTNPTGTIAPSGTGTLVVRADAANVGTFVATVTINSNDSNEAAFNFDIAVEVTEPAAGGDGVGGGLLQPKLSGFMLHPYHLKIRKRR